MFSSSSSRQRLLKRGAKGLGSTAPNKNKKQPHQAGISPTSEASSNSKGSNSSSSSFSFRLKNLGRRNKNKQQQTTEMTTIMNTMSPRSQKRLELVSKIAYYKQRGWISAREEETYNMLLESEDQDASSKVERLLNDAASKQQQHRRTNSSTGSSRSLFRRGGSNNKNANEPQEDNVAETELGPLQWNQENHSELNKMENSADADDDEPSDSSNANPPTNTTSSIVESQDVWDSNIIKDEQELETLFVEMCFFARLGFVQPPCCLKCVYAESMEKQAVDMNCQRYVVWRLNAKTLLHPGRLDENLVLVKCCAARKLIAGECVESREWDAMKRQLVYHM
jgi:hypothetical protein